MEDSFLQNIRIECPQSLFLIVGLSKSPIITATMSSHRALDLHKVLPPLGLGHCFDYCYACCIMIKGILVHPLTPIPPKTPAIERLAFRSDKGPERAREAEIRCKPCRGNCPLPAEIILRIIECADFEPDLVWRLMTTSEVSFITPIRCRRLN
jgi:ferredoxin